jgi:hypothetical protein
MITQTHRKKKACSKLIKQLPGLIRGEARPESSPSARNHTNCSLCIISLNPLKNLCRDASLMRKIRRLRLRKEPICYEKSDLLRGRVKGFFFL